MTLNMVTLKNGSAEGSECLFSPLQRVNTEMEVCAILRKVTT